MNSPHPSDGDNPAGTTGVGSDKVVVEQDRVVILATEPMDWPVREFCRMPIFFEGRKYYVRKVGNAASPHVKRYELWPWPPDQREQSSRSVTYDEAFVTERDEEASAGRRSDRVHMLLLPLYPFLGLCWSGFKGRVLVRLGFEPRSITSASVVLVFNLMIVEGIFVGWLRGGLLLCWFANEHLRSVDMALAALLAADAAIRYGQLLKLNVEKHWGFCEWLWPGRREET